jgi:hypothetical protein
LAIINSDAEAQYLLAEILKIPQEKYPGNFDRNNVHIGFNDLINHGVFRTIDGTLCELERSYPTSG